MRKEPHTIDELVADIADVLSDESYDPAIYRTYDSKYKILADERRHYRFTAEKNLCYNIVSQLKERFKYHPIGYEYDDNNNGTFTVFVLLMHGTRFKDYVINDGKVDFSTMKISMATLV